MTTYPCRSTHDLLMASQDGSEDLLTGELDIFQEPEDFFPKAHAPTVASHQMLSGDVLNVNLVGHNPLWGHLLWNAGRVISLYLEENSASLVKGKDVLELGAGAGLPSLVCSIMGASTVVVTDYPDTDLVENMWSNIESCGLRKAGNMHAEGYLWGSSPEKILSHLHEARTGFDILILADILFNHSEHAKLLSTVCETMKNDSRSQALVFFTPYRPWLLQKDLAFFDLARDAGLVVEKVLEKVMDKLMFVDDPGDELQRRTVYGYTMHWKNPTK